MFQVTRQEKAVVLFLAGVFLAGSLIRYVLLRHPRLADTLSVGEGAAYARVDINRAAFDDLIRVPYIGEKTARRILDYRKEHGKFTSFEELRNLRGIYPSSYEVMVKYLKL